MQLDVQAITGDLMKTSSAIDRLMFRTLSIIFMQQAILHNRFALRVLYEQFLKQKSTVRLILQIICHSCLLEIYKCYIGSIHQVKSLQRYFNKRTEYRYPVRYDDERKSNISVVFNFYRQINPEKPEWDMTQIRPVKCSFSDIISHINLSVEGESTSIMNPVDYKLIIEQFDKPANELSSGSKPAQKRKKSQAVEAGCSRTETHTRIDAGRIVTTMKPYIPEVDDGRRRSTRVRNHVWFTSNIN